MVHKGSRKHVLDLIDRKDFIDTLNNILQQYDANISDNKTVQPKGSNDDFEYELQCFIDTHNLAERFPSLKDVNSNFNKWWNPRGGKAPTWDMISLCQLNGKEAILLVEAKAHIKEFDLKGKRLKDNPSDGSITNHSNIEARIKEACDNLNCTYTGFDISRDKHYQLSNRVAFAWQLKQLNVPVVLLYLGFTGDTYFKTDFFEDHTHWEEEFTKYIKDVIPVNFINKNESDFLFIHSSLPIKK
jgi:hypothetical protein